LILNLELLEVNQVEPISQLLLFLKNLFKISVSIAQSDILETVLVDFLVFFSFYTFPVLNYFSIQLSASAAEDCVLGNTAL